MSPINKTLETVGLLRSGRMNPSAIAWRFRLAPEYLQQALRQNTCKDHGTRAAVSFQLMSGPNDKSTTLTWNQVAGLVTQAANLFRSLA